VASASYLIEYDQDRSSMAEVRLSQTAMLPGWLLEGPGRQTCHPATMGA
jgi:hypothetical protein